MIKPGKQSDECEKNYNFVFLSPRYIAIDTENATTFQPCSMFPILQSNLFPLLKLTKPLTINPNYHNSLQEIYLKLDIDEETPEIWKKQSKIVVELFSICSELPNLESFVFKSFPLELKEPIYFDCEFHEKSFPKLKSLLFTQFLCTFHPSFFEKYLANTSRLEELNICS